MDFSAKARAGLLRALEEENNLLRAEIARLQENQRMDQYNGYTIATKSGTFTMAHRDDGVEVVRDGVPVWSSREEEGTS